MTKPVFQLTVLGSRGSMASGRADCLLFGGDTSCYMVRAGDETVFLDGGSGIVAAPASYPKPPVILLTHLHLDHVMGLGMFPGFANRAQKSTLYIPFCADAALAEAKMDRVFIPPVWPLKLTEFEGDLKILPMPKSLKIGSLMVDSIPGSHPDGCLVLRLRYLGKTIIYATDYEAAEPSFSALSAFAENADLLLYDAQFEEAEYESKRGFGHSTAAKGLELMTISGAKQLLLIHHAPSSTDSMLLQREKKLPNVNASYAREGQTITLLGESGKSID